MAVKVYGTETHEHGNGTDLDVRDGHLLVTRSGGGEKHSVAIYAPGEWQRAEVK